MKKSYLLLFTSLLSAALLLSGCNDDTKVNGNDIESVEPTETISPETESETESETEIETEDSSSESNGCKDSELPPEEGMVRSAITNQWILEETYNARPIAVMMPTDKVAQPQYGIGEASVLYEIMEEGGISRQLAVIENWQELEKIGNIRSCRDYYLYAACEWDPILIHFGGVFYMTDRLAKGDINNISGAAQDGTGPAPGAGKFFRSDNKPAPHNAFISAEGIKEAMDDLGYDSQHRKKYYQPDHFNFANYNEINDLSSYSDAIDCNTLDLEPCYPSSKSMLEYNPDDQLYYKSLHGSAQIDATTGEQLTFTNIIVQFTDWNYQMDNKYLHFEMCDSGNDGWYITQGKAIPVTWSKKSDYAPTRYFDSDGNEIVLNTGKTYIAIVQNDKSVDID